MHTATTNPLPLTDAGREALVTIATARRALAELDELGWLQTVRRVGAPTLRYVTAPEWPPPRWPCLLALGMAGGAGLPSYRACFSTTNARITITCEHRIVAQAQLGRDGRVCLRSGLRRWALLFGPNAPAMLTRELESRLAHFGAALLRDSDAWVRRRTAIGRNTWSGEVLA